MSTPPYAADEKCIVLATQLPFFTQTPVTLVLYGLIPPLPFKQHLHNNILTKTTSLFN